MSADVAVGDPLGVDQPATASFGHVNRPGAGLAGLSVSPLPYISLSPTQLSVLRSVTLFRQMTTSQVRRLHYEGTPRGTKVRANRHLLRLERLGLIKKLPAPRGGYGGGSGEAIYLPATSKARAVNMHTLDIAQLYASLAEAAPSALVSFDPEPWCHVQVGHMELKPDAFIDTGKYRIFYECDQGTEYRSQLAQKMRRYCMAYEQWQENTFPLVFWSVPDHDRLRFVKSVIKQQRYPALFSISTFEDACSNILQLGS